MQTRQQTSPTTRLLALAIATLGAGLAHAQYEQNSQTVRMVDQLDLIYGSRPNADADFHVDYFSGRVGNLTAVTLGVEQETREFQGETTRLGFVGYPDPSVEREIGEIRHSAFAFHNDGSRLAQLSVDVHGRTVAYRSLFVPYGRTAYQQWSDRGVLATPRIREPVYIGGVLWEVDHRHVTSFSYLARHSFNGWNISSSRYEGELDTENQMSVSGLSLRHDFPRQTGILNRSVYGVTDVEHWLGQGIGWAWRSTFHRNIWHHLWRFDSRSYRL